MRYLSAYMYDVLQSVAKAAAEPYSRPEEVYGLQYFRIKGRARDKEDLTEPKVRRI